ncbi:unnamed protein product [Linum tenue]|uniref:Leucine-rich repeat-containing N-terminal plant-type domain-containing protein n=1 Tax=Linum tenue TaxID=586396 RepID=A0AAV0N7F8_9ROSI|nr:unnamed protein product [Linum tenue]
MSRLITLSLITSTLLILIIFPLNSTARLHPGDCRPTERQALLNFKQNLIDVADRLVSWSADHDHGDCCNWSNVVCDSVTGHVLELQLSSTSNLPEQAFSGVIDSSLSKLEQLTLLDLSDNAFGGIPLPSFLSSMKNLRVLNLARSGFGGSITADDQLDNLSNLRYLSLQGNYIKVETLEWLSSLSSLELLDLGFLDLGSVSDSWLDVINKLPLLVELRLSYCQLGQVPEFLNPVNFTSSMSVLDLSHNNISSQPPFPKWVLDLRSLTYLNLANNRFQGHIPEGIQNLSSLETLDLSWNSFSSLSPTSFSSLIRLRLFNLAFNNLGGDLSGAMGDMTSLVELDLSSNGFQFVGGIPNYFSTFCNLKLLTLSDVRLKQDVNQAFDVLSRCPANGLKTIRMSNCQLFGSLNISLAKFKNLDTLSLSKNSISGPLPKSLTDLGSLKYLELYSNKFHGTLPTRFGTLTNLESIDISDNLLEGDVYEIHFSNLTKLWMFRASGNLLRLEVGSDWAPPPQLNDLGLGLWRLGPRFPSWLQSLKLLNSLNLSNSGISSHIPSWVFKNCSKLVALDFSGNELAGTIPAWIGENLRKLMILNFRNNNFHGPIPEQLCEANSLRILDLANNNLIGRIPKCVNNFTAMLVRSIDLSENKLSGEIPWGMTRLEGLQSLNLSGNLLTGEIPEDVGAMRSLESIDLSQNQLSGEIPRSMSGMTFLSFLNFSDNKLSGRIPSSTQFDGFNASSFAGNLNLCGLPLARNCSNVPAPGQDGIGNGEEDEGHVYEQWYFYVSIAIGFIVGFWGVVGSLALSRSWRYGYFRFIDSLWYKFRTG